MSRRKIKIPFLLELTTESDMKQRKLIAENIIKELSFIDWQIELHALYDVIELICEDVSKSEKDEV